MKKSILGIVIIALSVINISGQDRDIYKDSTKKDGKKLIAVAVKLTIGVVPDANKEWWTGFRKRLEEANKKLWECTEGQMYISEAVVSDKVSEETSTADIIIRNLS